MKNTMIETKITETGLRIREEQQNERRIFNNKGKEIECVREFVLMVEEIQGGAQ